MTISPVLTPYRLHPQRHARQGAPIQFSSWHRSEPSSWGKHHWGEYNNYAYQLHIGDNSGYGSNVTGSFNGKQVDLGVYQSDYGSSVKGTYDHGPFESGWFRSAYGTSVDKKSPLTPEQLDFITLLAEEIFPSNSK